MRSFWSTVGFYSNMTGVLRRRDTETDAGRGEWHVKTDTRREDSPVVTEAETGVTWLQTKKYQE